MKYYLAGPMAGLPKHNFPYFDRTTKILRSRGYDVYSPHEIDHGEDDGNRGQTKSHGEYLKVDLIALLMCDAVILLPGWSTSRGAVVELNTAISCGMKVFIWDPRTEMALAA